MTIAQLYEIHRKDKFDLFAGLNSSCFCWNYGVPTVKYVIK